MVPDNSLFFQIASGLIPLLLFAGGLNEALRSRLRLSKQPPAVRWVMIVSIAVLVALTVLAEFFAIAAAVSADLTPSAFRTTLVADVLALETLLLGVGFLLPWLPSAPAVWLTLMVVVVGGTGLGLWMLSDAVNTANSRRTAALAHCVRRSDLEDHAAILTGQDHLDRANQRRLSLDKRSAALLSRQKALPPARRRAEFRAIQDERKVVNALYEAALNYVTAAVKLGIPDNPRDTEEMFAQTTGC